MVDKYLFLFVLAAIWTIFASIQDIKRREVDNWVNFSLLGFALAYRAFYSYFNSDWNFLLFGVVGAVLFYGLANLFYYAKIFGGGDARLLIAFGAILPFESWIDLGRISVIFIFILFFIGAIYSLVYGIFIVIRNRRKFVFEFSSMAREFKYFVWVSLLFAILSLAASLGKFVSFYLFLLFLIAPWVIFYVKSLDKCMIRKVTPNKLTIGDWIEKDIKFSGKIVKKTVHGLSAEDIKLLKKYKKSIEIKDGVPFIPVFLISLLIMVFSYLTLEHWMVQVLSLF